MGRSFFWGRPGGREGLEGFLGLRNGTNFEGEVAICRNLLLAGLLKSTFGLERNRGEVRLFEAFEQGLTRLKEADVGQPPMSGLPPKRATPIGLPTKT